MTDFLLVHGAGQGAWSWGRVWGYLTAPVEHPPRLYAPRRANRVYPLDLPGHGADAGGDTAEVRLEECVHAIARAVEREGLKDVVLVGHGFAAGLVLQAAGQLPEPPKRLVLVAGMVPLYRRSLLSVLPRRTRSAYQVLATLSKLSRQELKLPQEVIYRYMCNGIDHMEVVHVVGQFGALPTRVLKTKLTLDEPQPSCPITYVVLTQDRILPAELQQRMAERFTGIDVVELDSCHQVMLSKPRELADVLLSYA
ncbi:MAG: hypothetical protein BZY88_11380 [SAR202 cluster bacterium Io17-Chloro-G9]|nr:MAG: hypothetical protein BZY88_11380 [SAR202 cluster bacterium Io17-Chloro-G9]